MSKNLNHELKQLTRWIDYDDLDEDSFYEPEEKKHTKFKLKDKTNKSNGQHKSKKMQKRRSPHVH